MLQLRIIHWFLIAAWLTAAKPLSACGLRRRELTASSGVAPESWHRQLLQASSGGTCASSWLGYQCTRLVCGRIRIHWSVGGDPPGPGCSYSASSSQVVAPDPSAQLLHMALQTDVTGYVAASWPKHVGVMYPADAVIGFVGSDGIPSVGAYSISGKSANDVQPDGGVDIANWSVDVNATALTICFSRNMTQVGREAAIAITPANPVGMNFVASKAPFKHQHMFGKDYLCGASLLFLSSTGGADDGGWRPSNVSGSTANEDSVMAERLGYMRTHGALEFTGWIVLVPIGLLAARHRWVFAPMGIVGLWFQVHRAVQMLAVVLVVTGFVLPWTTFNSQDSQHVLGVSHDAHMASDSLLETHETLAITLVAILGVHILLAVVRPKPDATWRWAWNLLHWWAGRGLVLLAAVNVAIGIALWRRVSDGNGLEWIIPFVIFAVAWVSVAIWLERRAPDGRGRDGGTAPGAPDAALTVGYVSSSSLKGTPGGDVPLSRMAGTYDSGVPYNKL